ncbi:hypothetical protein PGTUg99_007394 [Puccinia graminis f. sp. tritici]|uniref:Uncharacterized protein n=1 Tax=Puccinia graminis f. sp. tritici TaxID=56615 RepID=A0A5B0QYM1_PUCGR|nr:hypothetical protein PGTUg99_007394 [Puccinia graminis f. sp. tritici]
MGAAQPFVGGGFGNSFGTSSASQQEVDSHQEQSNLNPDFGDLGGSTSSEQFTKSQSSRKQLESSSSTDPDGFGYQQVSPPAYPRVFRIRSVALPRSLPFCGPHPCDDRCICTVPNSFA